MTTLYVDIESRSPVDLKKSGVYRYAENRWTQILLLSWSIDDGPISTWYILFGEPCPPALRAAIIDPDVTIVAHNASFERVMLSVAGPRQIDADLCAGFRKIERWDCTAARSTSIGLPRALDNVAQALHLPVSKDKDGYFLMLRMCRPSGFGAGNAPLWIEDEASVRRLGAYCEVDVAVEILVDHAVPRLTPTERRIWELTERMNDRGIMVDRALVDRVSALVKKAELSVNERISLATEGRIPKVTNHKALRDWLVGNGYPDVEERGVGKPVINDMLESEDLPKFIREVLIMRREGGKSSAAKYKAINLRLNHDNRARGALMYCGAASTGRFSSLGIQLQNLPRGGTIKQMDKAIEAILTDASMEELTEEFGAPLILASEALRPCFVAPNDKYLARGDFGQIEARVLAWIAGEKSVVRAFKAYDTIIGYDPGGKPIRQGPDLYIVTAAQVFGVPISSIDKDDPRRQAGKVTILACIASDELVLTDHGEIPIQFVTTDMKLWDGVEWVNHDGLVYRGEKDCISYDGLCATEDHEVYVEDIAGTVPFGLAAARAARLRRSGLKEKKGSSQRLSVKARRKVWDILNAGPRHRFTVSGRLAHNCGYQGGVGAIQAFAKVYGLKITDLEAEEIKKAWREANPNIVQLWWDLDNAAKDCVRGDTGVKHEVRPGLWFVRGNNVLTMRMPSGRSLFYWEPKLVTKTAPWGETEVVQYYAMDHVKKTWSDHYGYGGLWAENLTQAVARDIMTFALENLEGAGFPPVLTVHDEAVCEVSRFDYVSPTLAAQAVIDVMLKVPVWANGLPIAVDGSAGYRYVKG